MKVIEDNLPEQWEDEDGSLLFSSNGYMYEIFSIDNQLHFARQPIDEYYDGIDNWEKIERWVPETKDVFIFFKGLNRIND